MLMANPRIIDLLLWFRICLYCIYRLTRYIILLESDIFSFFRRFWTPHNGVQFFNVLTRLRLDSSDIARDCDFMIFHESVGSFQEICDKRWVIYSISDRYVYFVRVTDSDQSIETHPKIVDFYFTSADRVARMYIEDFLREAKVLSGYKGRVVFLHSTPSGGGTVSGKLLQSSDPSREMLQVIGEPPVLSSLAVLSHFFSIEKMRSICHAALRYSLQHQRKNQTVVFKARSCCAKIVPYVHSTSPSIQHIFLSSRRPTDGISRLIQNTSSQLPVFDKLSNLLSWSPLLCDIMSGWRLLEPDTITKIGPKDAVEWALAQIMGATISYQRNLKYYALDTIYFEDLISDTATVVRPILDVCDISDLAIPDCIAWKRNEERTIRRIWEATPLAESQQERIRTLADCLQQDWCH